MPINHTIATAVFPVAGLGTRFLPATKAQPKEMLPVVDKPLIQYAVEEAYAAGIRHMVFVTGRNKRAIEDHFDLAYELEFELQASQKQALLALVREVQPADMLCSYVRQPRSLGLGHAVLCAEHLVGNQPFAVLLADDLMRGEAHGPGVLTQMVDIFARTGASLLAVQTVPDDQVQRYGIVVGQPVPEPRTAGEASAANSRLLQLSHIVEKPKPQDTPARTAVAGRYLLTPAIFAHLRRLAPGAQGEIQLTDGIASLMQSESVQAYVYRGKRYDCGSKLGFLEATVELALEHPEVAAPFGAFLKALRAT
ncbi:MAG: UTP--glucose-1-phosphate uridylyltransferase GalU [Burkholderiaceae bacterium]